MRNMYNILVGKSQGSRQLGRPTHWWKNNIKIYLKGLWCVCVCVCADWIHLAQDRDQWRTLVNMIMNLRFPQKAENFLT